MKFKLSHKFSHIVEQFLTTRSIAFQTEQDPDQQSLIFDIQYNNQERSNLEHQISERLLEEFHRAKLRGEELTVNQWMRNFHQNITKSSQLRNEQSLVVESLNNALLSLQIDQSKKQLREASNALAVKIEDNKILKQKYEQSTKIHERKCQLTLANIELRMQQGGGDQDDDQQLQRVQSILNNGMWGMLEAIEAKMAKIAELECEVLSRRQGP